MEWRKKNKNLKNDSEGQPYVWFIIPFIYIYYFIVFVGTIAILKFMLSVCIGIFVLPFRLYKNIKRLNEIKKLEAAYTE